MVLQHPVSNESINCGLDINAVPDICAALSSAREQNFDFVSLPLVHPRYYRDLADSTHRRPEPFTRSDLLLNSSQWSHYVVGKVSACLQFDSPVAATRRNAELALRQELAWATHLSLPAVLLPTPSFHSTNFAKTTNQALLGLSHMQVWVRIPLVSPTRMVNAYDADEAGAAAGGEGSSGGAVGPTEREDDPWEWWNAFRTACEHNPLLSPALEVTAELPPREELARWRGEPVKALFVPTSIFLTNKRGFPTLSKRHQDFISSFFKYKVSVVVTGKTKHPEGVRAYQNYLSYLLSRAPAPTEQEQFEGPYLDYLQAPLQPLQDNLESQTYETFEKDPIKYVRYEQAVEAALRDRAAPGSVTVLMVVGAGRGPLVRASLRASKSANRKLRVYAVEKNPNAVVTLQNAKETEGWEEVEVVASDMRDWEAPVKADIVVSELLGSWGDNELSPECLDGITRHMKEDGISIPCEYTSFAAPLSSSKLFNEVKAYNDLQHFETPYVVKIHNAHQLAEAQPVFVFHHPNRCEPQPPDNSRYACLSFTTADAATMHGFVGYFHAKLYGDVYISIEPRTFSEGMFSWFPLFIPLRNPVYVPKGARITAHFWRNNSRQKVWYEWAVTEPVHSPVHNPNGRSYWIGL
eukprot:tig00021350_g20637.t1